MVTILEAATSARITKQKVRYWLELLDVEITKNEGKFYLPTGAVDLLTSMQKAVASGISPAVAAIEIKAIQALPAKSPAPICNQDNHTAGRIGELEKAVMLLAATVEKQTRVIEQQSVIIARQSSRLDLIAVKLLPQPGKNVNVWEPQPRQTQNVSFFKRLWLELINPVALRVTP